MTATDVDGSNIFVSKTFTITAAAAQVDPTVTAHIIDKAIKEHNNTEPLPKPLDTASGWFKANDPSFGVELSWKAGTNPDSFWIVLEPKSQFNSRENESGRDIITLNQEGNTPADGTIKIFAHNYGYYTFTWNGAETRWDWSYTLAEVEYGQHQQIIRDAGGEQVVIDAFRKACGGNGPFWNPGKNKLNDLSEDATIEIPFIVKIISGLKSVETEKQTIIITGDGDQPVSSGGTSGAIEQAPVPDDYQPDLPEPLYVDMM